MWSEAQDGMEYWTQYLADSSPAEFLTDYPRPSILAGGTKAINFSLNVAICEKLREISASQQVDDFVILQAAFRVAHYRLTGSEDATFCTLTTTLDSTGPNRSAESYDNKKFVRSTVNDESTFEDVCIQLNATATTAREKGAASLDRIVTVLKPGALEDTSRHPLVQLLLSLESHAVEKTPTVIGKLGSELLGISSVPINLHMHFTRGPNSLGGVVSFASDLFEDESAQAVIDVFQEVLRRGLDDPNTKVASLQLTDGHERLRKMRYLGIEKTNYPRDSNLADTFRKQATACPDTVAIKDSSSQMTYAELDQRSDGFASWLSQRNMPLESIVAVFAPRSCLTIVAYFGILKAGLAYLPLHTEVPVERLEAILSEIAGKKLVLLGSGIEPPPINREDVELVRISDVLNQHKDGPDLQTRVCPAAQSLAYVTFTSGSTGRPKGVMIEHRGILRLLKQDEYVGQLPIGHKTAHIASLAFDASMWEINATLLNGGTLVCVDQATVSDIRALSVIFEKEQIQAALLTPPALKSCLTSAPHMLSTVEVLMLAGDRLDAQDASRIRSLIKGNAFNAYGPSEASIGSTLWPLVEGEAYANGTPIGRSVPNAGILIMNPQQEIVSLGVMGEIVVIGDGVSRGYTDTALNQDRFFNVTINGGEVVRAYRTRDKGRWRPRDGQIEFFGRIDQQIKVRGHRIDLGDIEQAILGDALVRDSAVIALGPLNLQNPVIVAFITIKDTHEDNSLERQTKVSMDNGHQVVDQIQTRLEKRLSPYMLPAHIVLLNRMPVNSNGKVDRRRLTERAHHMPHVVATVQERSRPA